jgi:hypothetical protein
MRHWMEYVRASYEVIMVAEERSQINLEHEVEAFVVHTFARYMEQPNIPTDAIAIKMMSATATIGEARKRNFEEIAQECLLIDGLELNSRRWPSNSYFRDMGKLALEHRAWTDRPPELFFERISHQFDKISQVLHTVKL